MRKTGAAEPAGVLVEENAVRRIRAGAEFRVAVDPGPDFRDLLVIRHQIIFARAPIERAARGDQPLDFVADGPLVVDTRADARCEVEVHEAVVIAESRIRRQLHGCRRSPAGGAHRRTQIAGIRPVRFIALPVPCLCLGQRLAEEAVPVLLRLAVIRRLGGGSGCNCQT